MPIKIPSNLPAFDKLQNENIFVMDADKAFHQDIRPLKIAIFNIMPTKIVTETQLMRVLGNTPLQVDITLFHPASYQSKNTPADHLAEFYQTFEKIKLHKFDGLVITGAPVENIPFEEVAYWDELVEILDWSETNATSTMFICWGAQAAMYHFYEIEKRPLDKKLFGIYKHTVVEKNIKLLRGFDDEFYVPHSRCTYVSKEDILANGKLTILSESEEAGPNIIASKTRDKIFVMGHSEYDQDTLKLEYERDINRGIEIEIPKNYFRDDDPSKDPIVTWRGHANLFFSNWLNYYVYQQTPFNLE
jgi:homoserine O-succinyltransferase